MLLISPETEVCATMVWPAGMDERPLAGGIPSPTIMRRVVAVDIPEFRLIDQRRRMAAILGGSRLGYERNSIERRCGIVMA